MYLFFSDIDGTLLDHDTYSCEQSMPGIRALKELHIPLVLVSSKTYHEILRIHDELLLDAPFVFENGGGIRWQDGTVEWIGMKVSALYAKKNALEAAAELSVRFITDMEIGEIVALTGLPHDRAALARQRTTSLPFILPRGGTIESADMARINNILADSGVAITKGGRFFHLLAKDSDKGSAVRKIIQDYRNKQDGKIISVGIGDNENDIPMLRAVNQPFVVKKKTGSGINTGMDNVRVTAGIGPAGFTEAVLFVVSA
jgi:mannosyl-3-phosphoglycerate phosphatase